MPPRFPLKKLLLDIKRSVKRVCYVRAKHSKDIFQHFFLLIFAVINKEKQTIWRNDHRKTANAQKTDIQKP